MSDELAFKLRPEAERGTPHDWRAGFAFDAAGAWRALDALAVNPPGLAVAEAVAALAGQLTGAREALRGALAADLAQIERAGESLREQIAAFALFL
jgi:hypothetical protein